MAYHLFFTLNESDKHYHAVFKSKWTLYKTLNSCRREEGDIVVSRSLFYPVPETGEKSIEVGEIDQVMVYRSSNNWEKEYHDKLDEHSDGETIVAAPLTPHDFVKENCKDMTPVFTTASNWNWLKLIC